MSASTYTGNADAPVAGLCPAPPPPPPPPAPGRMPVMRIDTVESSAPRRPQPSSNDPYEPPAAIQNAMLTKDKKPFTYTPGMGGKLDLSQIRSPRMARRVAKNANDEGIEGPPKSALEQKPTPSATPNVFVQPQVAVPVFPTNVPPAPINRINQQPTLNRLPSNAAEKIPEVPKPTPKIETKVTPITITSGQSSTPESPSTPTQVTLAKAPTPWLQNKNKPQEELPEWAKRSNSIKTPTSSPESPATPPTYTSSPQQVVPQWQPAQQIVPQWQQNQPKQQSPQYQQQSPQYQQQSPQYQQQSPQYQQQSPQYQQQSPQYQQRSPSYQPQSPQYGNQTPQQFQKQPQQFQRPQQPQPFVQQQQPREHVVPVMIQQQQNTQKTAQGQTQERVIPIRIEDRPSVFAVKQEPGHHQFKQPPSSHHQQRWGQPAPNQTQNRVQQPQPQSQPQQQQQQQQQQPQQSQQSGGAYIIPIMVEGDPKKSQPAATPANSYAQSNARNQPVENQVPKMNVAQRASVPIQQAEPGPVQSRSFRVLQKITDTDSPNDVDPEEMRKLKLTEDDRTLMNKFKEQVDGDTYLHQEEDPRYRGAAIPSRAFRYLQNMTDSGEISSASTTPRAQNAVNKKQNRNSKSFEESQANLPPSEQQAPEPRKYMGSAIPSRSFRILQAMTAPESVGPDTTDY